MFLLRRWHMLLLSAALLTTPAWAARSHRSPTAHRHHYRHHRRYVHHYAPRQTGMAADRITQIQTALISQHYLTGTPNGVWDAKTQAAMRSYQADHGWQTKLMPDARALIALGLGPKTDETHLADAKTPQQPQPSIDYADTLAAVQIIPK